MTLRNDVLVAAAMIATFVLGTVHMSTAHACGSYGNYSYSDTAQVRRVVSRANAALVAKDRKAGHFATRKIKSVNLKKGPNATSQLAVVQLDVTWDYHWFTEIVTLVKVGQRWTIANRIKVNRRIKTAVTLL